MSPPASDPLLLALVMCKLCGRLLPLTGVLSPDEIVMPGIPGNDTGRVRLPVEQPASSAASAPAAASVGPMVAVVLASAAPPPGTFAAFAVGAKSLGALDDRRIGTSETVVGPSSSGTLTGGEGAGVSASNPSPRNVMSVNRLCSNRRVSSEKAAQSTTCRTA